MTQILNGEPPANTEKVEVNTLPGMQFCYSGGGTTVAQQAIIDLLKNRSHKSCVNLRSIH
ncbi:hypothetical protein [Chamaesiphon sp.]|uniref:hypothetical protein n=1 Tax=Chamaesiphon sp. TaxID=2814140 RepID=UPI003593051E